MNYVVNENRGFSLVEILVVIGIIGLLSSMILVNLNNVRVQAKIARAQIDLKEFQKAILLLEDDTGETAGHFPLTTIDCLSSTGSNELYLDTDTAGLASTDGLFSGWGGPYISRVPLDPWGQRYIFDDDYTCSSGVLGCGDITGDTRVIHSGGPNASGIDVNDSDNVVLVLCKR